MVMQLFFGIFTITRKRFAEALLLDFLYFFFSLFRANVVCLSLLFYHGINLTPSLISIF